MRSLKFFATASIVSLVIYLPSVSLAVGPSTDYENGGFFSTEQAQSATEGYGSTTSTSSSSATSPTTAAASLAASSADDASTLGKLAGADEECLSAAKANVSACGDPNSSAGMSAAESAQMTQGLGMIAMMSASAAASSGSAKACMMANTLNMALQGMGLVKSLACKRTIAACQTKCNAKHTTAAANFKTTGLASWDTEAVKDQSASTMCGGNNAKASAMTSQMMLLGMSAMNSLNCKSQTSDSAVAALASATPASLVGTTLDCTNQSYAATSTACICAADPTNALCGGTSATATGTTGGIAAGGVGTPGVTTATDDEGNVIAAAPGSTPEKGIMTTGGGAGGGGVGGGGPSGLNPDGSGGGGDGTGINKDVITGASGGGAGGLSAAGGGGGGGLSKPGGSAGGGGGGFNLAKYLPKNMFKNRGLAGMTVPAQDGVTGPLGPSIWEKVHTRYEDKKSTLIQEK